MLKHDHVNVCVAVALRLCGSALTHTSTQCLFRSQIKFVQFLHQLALEIAVIATRQPFNMPALKRKFKKCEKYYWRFTGFRLTVVVEFRWFRGSPPNHRNIAHAILFSFSFFGVFLHCLLITSIWMWHAYARTPFAHTEMTVRWLCTRTHTHTRTRTRTSTRSGHTVSWPDGNREKWIV